MSHLRLLIIIGLALAVLSSCRKDRLFTDDPSASLEFSRDTILFDTVFTQSPASVMKRFVARNPQNRAVRVNITLAGGTPSPFRINVDGLSGISFSDVEILAGDSVYVFVEATLDQNNVNAPLIVEDLILFNTNGNQQQVLLQAFGQDAYYHYPGPDSIQVAGFPRFNYVAGGFDPGWVQICETVTWAADKPHVVIGYAVVDSCSTLIIEPGARIHVHGGGGMWIYRHGRIIANGTIDQPITFQGDRLEPFYAELPGQWDRIWINEGPAGGDNVFTNVTIKNALIGLQPESWPFEPELGTSANELVLNNVNIRNCSAAGILSRNYRITSNNLFVGDCGQHSVALTGGGEYFFNHSTIANYWNLGIRQTPAFIMTNSFQAFDGSIHVREIVNSQFVNGIIYGANENELQIALDAPEMQQFTFNRFLFKTTEATDNTQFFPDQAQIHRNQSPGFVSVQDRNFDLLETAFARDKGIPVPGNIEAINDILGRSRNCAGFPDLGAYEYCP